QLMVALQRATTPLGRKGDWVVLAAWLLLLRSRLLLPVETLEQPDAAERADQLRDRLVALQAAQALAAWLDQRPQLGHEVFARGQPELLSTSTANQYEVAVIEFLWACAAQFDDDAAPVDIATVYRPSWHDLYSVLDARTHILRLLASDHLSLERFLPDVPSEDGAKLALWRRSAVASTLMAGLELARDGVVIGAGMDVTLVGPLPTPAIALLTRSLRADLGVMISASHNPYEDNGIKLFGPDGAKLSDAMELEIEALMDSGFADRLADPADLGRASRL